LETNDQREDRYRKQMEYQEVLREQMKMKKAKDDEERRLRLEQEFRDE
jgi:hypothetical protein